MAPQQSSGNFVKRRFATTPRTVDLRESEVFTSYFRAMLLSLKKKKQTRTGGAGGAAGARRVDPGLLRVTKGTVMYIFFFKASGIFFYVFLTTWRLAVILSTTWQ